MMKGVTTICLSVFLISSLATAQNSSKKKAGNQSRAISRSLSRLVASGGSELLNAKFDAEDDTLRGRPICKRWEGRSNVLAEVSQCLHRETKHGEMNSPMKWAHQLPVC